MKTPQAAFALAALFCVAAVSAAADPPVVTIDSNKNFCINGAPTFLIGTMGGDAYDWQTHLSPYFNFRFLGSTSIPGAHSVGLWELPDVFADPTQIVTMKTDPYYLMWELDYETDASLRNASAWVGRTLADFYAKKQLCIASDNTPRRPVGVCWGNVSEADGSELWGKDGYWHSYREYAQPGDYFVCGDYYYGFLTDETQSHSVRVFNGPVIALIRCWPWEGFGSTYCEEKYHVMQNFWQPIIAGAKGIIVDRWEMYDPNGVRRRWVSDLGYHWVDVITKSCREIKELSSVLTAPGAWTYYKMRSIEGDQYYRIMYTFRKLGSDLYLIAVNTRTYDSSSADIYVPISEAYATGEVLFDDRDNGTITTVVNSTTIKDFTKSWTANQHMGKRLHIRHGDPAHDHYYTIASNTSNTITITSGDFIADGVAVLNTYDLFAFVQLVDRKFRLSLPWGPQTRKVIKFANVTYTPANYKIPAPTAQSSNRRWVVLQDFSSQMAAAEYPMDAYGMCYDANRRRLVVQGGLMNAQPQGKANPTDPDVVPTNYVWEWDLNTGYYSGPIKDGMQQGGDPWPPASWYNDMVYDPVRRCTVAYNKAVGQQEWRGVEQGWRIVPRSSTDPNDYGPISHYVAVYSPALNKTLMYGGKDWTVLGSNYRNWQFYYEWRNILYSYDGSGWLAQNDSSNLPATALEQPAMCYDTTRNKAILYGLSHDGRYSGTEQPQIFFQDSPQQMYEYDSTSCYRKYPFRMPYVYANYRMVFDPRTSTALLFGGVPSVNGKFTDLYEWNGTDWKRLAYNDSSLPAQDPRRVPTLTWDPDHQMVLFLDTRGGKIWGLTKGTEASVSTIQAAKNLANGTVCIIEGKVVGRQFNGYFYMQEPDRSQGIRVVSSSASFAPGTVVNVIGTVQTLATGEKQIVAQVAGKAGSTGVVPLAMNNGSLVGTGYAGIFEPWGAPNVGLLVRTFGKVTYVGSDHIYADDGSGMADNSGRIGVKIRLSWTPDPNLLNRFVSATGIASVESIGGQNARVLLVSDAADLLTLL